MRRMQMYPNWKVLAGLAAMRVGLYLVAPGLAAALPLLLMTVCPPPMLLMMKGMRGSRCGTRGQRIPEETAVGVAQEEQVTQLRMQQTDIAGRIEALEQEEEPQRAGNGRHGA